MRAGRKVHDLAPQFGAPSKLRRRCLNERDAAFKVHHGRPGQLRASVSTRPVSQQMRIVEGPAGNDSPRLSEMPPIAMISSVCCRL